MESIIKANFEIRKGLNISGILDQKNNNKKFSCWSSDFFHVEGHSDIYGQTHDNEKISLINCLGAPSSISRGDHISHTCEIYSHTMIIGYEHVIPSDKSIKTISFRVVKSEALLPDVSSFGYLQSPKEELIQALNEEKYTPLFDSTNNPVIAYYNGQSEIFKQKTKIGTISARHCPSYGFLGHPTGVKIRNSIVISLTFQSPQDLESTFKSAGLLSHFLRLIGGKGLYFENVKLQKEDCDELLEVCHDNHNWGEQSNNDFYSDPLIK